MKKPPNLESLEDYMIRKIIWAKEQFIKEKKIPSLAQLIVKAVVRNKVSKESIRITEFLDEILKAINLTGNHIFPQEIIIKHHFFKKLR